MDISTSYANSINSVKQALSMVGIKKAVNQDAQTVNKLIESMEESSRQELERKTVSHKGQNIDTWA